MSNITHVMAELQDGDLSAAVGFPVGRGHSGKEQARTADGKQQTAGSEQLTVAE
jgi:hypothetical protein